MYNYILNISIIGSYWQWFITSC